MFPARLSRPLKASPIEGKVLLPGRSGYGGMTESSARWESGFANEHRRVDAPGRGSLGKNPGKLTKIEQEILKDSIRFAAGSYEILNPGGIVQIGRSPFDQGRQSVSMSSAGAPLGLRDCTRMESEGFRLDDAPEDPRTEGMLVTLAIG